MSLDGSERDEIFHLTCGHKDSWDIFPLLRRSDRRGGGGGGGPRPEMSSSCIDLVVGSEHLCYVHCNHCSTVLAVSVPYSSLFRTATVRCGHCTNLLSVNMRGLFQALPHQNYSSSYESSSNSASSSITDREDTIISCSSNQIISNDSPPQKRQRVPSAYNRFIRDEIQRIKANNPNMSHKEAFSTAAKNVAFILSVGSLSSYSPGIDDGK
eukprot:Gb_22423 [translate_table: standard]